MLYGLCSHGDKTQQVGVDAVGTDVRECFGEVCAVVLEGWLEVWTDVAGVEVFMPLAVQ